MLLKCHLKAFSQHETTPHWQHSTNSSTQPSNSNISKRTSLHSHWRPPTTSSTVSSRLPLWNHHSSFHQSRTNHPHPVPKPLVPCHFCPRGLARSPTHIPSARPVLPVTEGPLAGVWAHPSSSFHITTIYFYVIWLPKLMPWYYAGSPPLGVVWSAAPPCIMIGTASHFPILLDSYDFCQ